MFEQSAELRKLVLSIFRNELVIVIKLSAN